MSLHSGDNQFDAAYFTLVARKCLLDALEATPHDPVLIAPLQDAFHALVRFEMLADQEAVRRAERFLEGLSNSSAPLSASGHWQEKCEKAWASGDEQTRQRIQADFALRRFTELRTDAPGFVAAFTAAVVNAENVLSSVTPLSTSGALDAIVHRLDEAACDCLNFTDDMKPKDKAAAWAELDAAVNALHEYQDATAPSASGAR